LIVSSPILISGLSYGAVSKKVRIVIAKAAKELKIGFNSGEGGITKEEITLARDFLIGQYATGRFGITEEVLKKVAAVEIRFGQGAYPGKGSYLPADKITPDIAKIRGLKIGEAAYSPAHHPDMVNLSGIRKKVNFLRKITNGVPIGAKIGCGNIEADLNILVKAGVDFVALDGFGGGTGATELHIRENVGIPIIAALPRAANFLKKLKLQNKISLIAGGALRTSADFVKCLALGANAIYIGTAALIAINCEQYRLCHTGLCPTGITTQNPGLTNQINIDAAAQRLINFVKVMTREMESFVRVVGKNDIRKLDRKDLVSLNYRLAKLLNIQYLD